MTTSSNPVINVNQGEFKKLEGNGVLRTEDLTTCIGVSLYIPAEKIGFLGHFDNTAFSKGLLENMIEEYYRSSLLPHDHTRIWVGGGEILSPTSVKHLGISALAETIELANLETESHKAKVQEELSLLVINGAQTEVNYIKGQATMNYSMDVFSGKSSIEIVRY